MWRILQHQEAEDFVVATGETKTVREFCTLAFRYAGIELEWDGTGIDEKGIDKKTGRVFVEVSREFFRPAEVDLLLGNPEKAKRELHWDPRQTTFEALVQLMVKHDMEYVKRIK